MWDKEKYRTRTILRTRKAYNKDNMWDKEKLGTG